MLILPLFVGCLDEVPTSSPATSAMTGEPDEAPAYTPEPSEDAGPEPTAALAAESGAEGASADEPLSEDPADEPSKPDRYAVEPADEPAEEGPDPDAAQWFEQVESATQADADIAAEADAPAEDDASAAAAGDPSFGDLMANAFNESGGFDDDTAAADQPADDQPADDVPFDGESSPVASDAAGFGGFLANQQGVTPTPAEPAPEPATERTPDPEPVVVSSPVAPPPVAMAEPIEPELDETAPLPSADPPALAAKPPTTSALAESDELDALFDDRPESIEVAPEARPAPPQAEPRVALASPPNALRDATPAEPLPTVPVRRNNTRHMAWLLGGKSALAGLADLDGATPTELNAWRRDAAKLADELSLDAAPPASGAGAAAARVAELVGSAADVGTALTLRHGADHAALFEIALKSNVLLVLPRQSVGLVDVVAAAVEDAARRASLPESLWAEAVRSLREARDAEAVEAAVSRLYADVERQLR